MLASNLTPQDMRKESRRLIKNISRRVARIEALGNQVPQTAAIQYRRLEANIPKRLTMLSTKELQTLYRDLRYIEGLKTSTVKGARETQTKWEPIRQKLDALSKTQQDKFWEVYGKYYEKTSDYSKFKYEIFETAIDYVYGAQDVDDILSDIISLYDEIYEKQDEGEVSASEARVLFAQGLQGLRRQLDRDTV